MNRFATTARAATLAGLAACGIAWSAAASATDYDAVPHGTMTVHGTDFASPHAVARLTRRLDQVAVTICMGDAGRQTTTTLAEQACYRTAYADGMAQIARRQDQALRDRQLRLADDNRARSALR